MRINKVVKCFSVGALALCMLFGASSTASAATSAKWNIHYVPGGPSSVSNQIDDVYVAYYGKGFIANCKTLTGTQGRMLKITAENAGGLKDSSVVDDGELSVTITGLTDVFKTKEFITGNVQFRVKAAGRYSCDSTGVIKNTY